MRLKKRWQKSKLVNVSYHGDKFTQSLLTLTLALDPWVLPPPNGNRRAGQRAQFTVVVGGFLTFEPERHFLHFLRLG